MASGLLGIEPWNVTGYCGIDCQMFYDFVLNFLSTLVKSLRIVVDVILKWKVCTKLSFFMFRSKQLLSFPFQALKNATFLTFKDFKNGREAAKLSFVFLFRIFRLALILSLRTCQLLTLERSNILNIRIGRVITTKLSFVFSLICWIYIKLALPYQTCLTETNNVY